MSLFSVVEEPYAAVGQGTMAMVRGAGGAVRLQGDDAAVHAAMKALAGARLASEEVAITDPSIGLPVWLRVIAVDSAGRHYALAFTLAPGTEIGLQEIEQIENFCSQKIGSAVLLLRWDIVAPPRQAQIIAQEPVAALPGEDVIGGVKAVPQEDVETELVEVPEARPESKAVRPTLVRS